MKLWTRRGTLFWLTEYLFVYLFRPQCLYCNECRRGVVARSECCRMGVKRRSNRSRIAIVTSALFRLFPSALLYYFNFRRNHLACRVKAVTGTVVFLLLEMMLL